MAQANPERDVIRGQETDFIWCDETADVDDSLPDSCPDCGALWTDHEMGDVARVPLDYICPWYVPTVEDVHLMDNRSDGGLTDS